MYLLYSVLLGVGFALSLPWFLWKQRSTKKYVRTFRERAGRLPVYLNVDAEESLWIHAVSVGEVLAARPLIGALRKRLPRYKVFVSTTTVTGNAVARESLRGIDGLFFAPFDWRGPVRHALATLNPAALVLVETEIWPNLIHEARSRGARVALVNGRISPRSHRRYLWIRSFLRRVLGELDLLAMQGEAHARRVVEMGAPPDRVRVLGNIKFDAVEARPADRLARLLAASGAPERPVWIAGSTAPGEEEMVLSAFHRIRERVPATRLVIAPRHPERFGEVPPLVEASGFGCVRRTGLDSRGWTDGEVLLLDSLGELAGLYGLATAVFVGGSLVPAGGHNILEAAVAGKAVVVGPHMENFQEIADEFRSEGGLVQIRSPDELAGAILGLLTDSRRRQEIGERARGLIRRNSGAVERTADAVAELLA